MSNKGLMVMGLVIAALSVAGGQFHLFSVIDGVTDASGHLEYAAVTPWQKDPLIATTSTSCLDLKATALLVMNGPGDATWNDFLANGIEPYPKSYVLFIDPRIGRDRSLTECADCKMAVRYDTYSGKPTNSLPFSNPNLADSAYRGVIFAPSTWLQTAKGIGTDFGACKYEYNIYFKQASVSLPVSPPVPPVNGTYPVRPVTPPVQPPAQPVPVSNYLLPLGIAVFAIGAVKKD